MDFSETDFNDADVELVTLERTYNSAKSATKEAGEASKLAVDNVTRAKENATRAKENVIKAEAMAESAKKAHADAYMAVTELDKSLKLKRIKVNRMREQLKTKNVQGSCPIVNTGKNDTGEIKSGKSVIAVDSNSSNVRVVIPGPDGSSILEYKWKTTPKLNKRTCNKRKSEDD